jgi:hypothetical protein
MIPKHILPLWNIQDFHNLEYNQAYHKDQQLNDQYVASGHNRECMTVKNYFEPSPMPESINYIRECFSDLSNISVAVNLFMPGTYLPMHGDLYGRYREVHNTDKKIVRAIIMLEDSVPGQVVQIENQAWANWTAGTVFHWFDSAQHAFYNMSMKNRYAIQLTGLVNE